ncbi:regulatory particle non-ATPase 13 [Arctopsyche grandis]|uniref:regulatory particle non-ATPase 13 n=1 Tax=Arctopsyche grandis TaxID=121162 RepID=UPI00406D7179
MSGALFVGGSGGGAAKHLVEFRAGRLALRDGVVTADRRRGLLYLFQGDDSLLHFCWRDRNTGHVEDDYILFPGDCEYARVAQCTTGRVYVLKFNASSRRLFFWMQEPKTDKDDEYCRRINEVLNNPPSVGGGRSSSGGAPDGELQNILNNMSQQQLMQLFGGVGQMGGLSSLLSTMGRSPTGQSSRSSSNATPTNRPPSETPRAPSRPPRVVPVTAPTPTTPSTPNTPNTPSTQTQQPATTRSQPIHLSDLQKYLSGLTNTSSDEGSSSKPSTNEVVDLASVISTPEVIATAGPHASGLMEHLPPPAADQQQDDIKTTLLSPQFAQAMTLFSNAIASGQLGPIISQFGLGSEAVLAAQSGDMKAFIKALEKEESKTDESKKPKEKDEDENMALD